VADPSSVIRGWGHGEGSGRVHHDVKLSGARIQTHDLWIRKRVCYPLHHTVTTAPTKECPLSRPRWLSANLDLNASRTYPFGTPGHRALSFKLGLSQSNRDVWSAWTRHTKILLQSKSSQLMEQIESKGSGFIICFKNALDDEWRDMDASSN